MSNIEKLCGLKKNENNFKTFASDGSFVFENDPEYDSITLTDYFNRTITVNSYEECEHYVIGGWSSSQSMNLEYLSQYVLLITLLIAIVKKKFLKSSDENK